MSDFIYAFLVGDDTPDNGPLSSIFWQEPDLSLLTRELFGPFASSRSREDSILFEKWLDLHKQQDKKEKKADMAKEDLTGKDKTDEHNEKVSDKKTSKQNISAEGDLVVRLRHELDHVNGIAGELFRVGMTNLSKQKDERLLDAAEHGLVTSMMHVMISYRKLIEAFLEYNDSKHSK